MNENVEVAKALTKLAQSLVSAETEEKKVEEKAEEKAAASVVASDVGAVGPIGPSCPGARGMTAGAIEANFREAVYMARQIMAAKPEPRVNIDKLPGLSPMQIKAYLGQIVEVRQKLEVMRSTYESVLTELTGLEDKEKAAIGTLKEAAEQMKEKGRYLISTEKALLEFTAYSDTKRPGIKQMLFDPSEIPVGEKGGELINRVAAKLGAQVADAVAQIYRETYEDLSHAADAVKSLKVVAKTAGVQEERLKKAGLSDFVVGVKDWLSGASDAFTKKVMGFAGDITRWIKGFAERTKIVKSNADTIEKALDTFMGELDKANA
jgi:hypothetical protein